MAEENNVVRNSCIALDWPYARGEMANILFSRNPYDPRIPKRAIDFGDFKLKNPSLSPSPIYINLRTTDHPVIPGPLIRGDMRKLATEIRNELFAAGILFDYVAGVPYGGEPIADAFLELLADGKARAAKFDKIGQESSRRIVNFKIVVTPCQGLARKKVLLIDDVLSSGASLLEAIEAVKKAGYEVSCIGVVVDREQGGREILNRRGYNKIVSVYRISQLLAFGVLNGKISDTKFTEVMDYIAHTREIILSEKQI